MDENTMTVKYMETILNRVACGKHNAVVGVPCWFVIPDASKFGMLFGACGSRTRKAGFVGTSTQDSLKVKSVRRFKK